MIQAFWKSEARGNGQGSAEPGKELTAGLALLFVIMGAVGCGGDPAIEGDELIDDVSQAWGPDGKNGVTPAILAAGHLSDASTFPPKVNSLLDQRPIKLCGTVGPDPITGDPVCTLKTEWAKWLLAYGNNDPITFDRFELLRAMTHCSMEPNVTVLAPGFPGVKGMFGLYPSWMVARLEMAQRAVVSACVAAKVNAFGVQVPIAFIGPDVPQPIFNSSFSYQEGSFFGDLFGKEPLMMACSGKRQSGGSYVIGKNLRVCGEAGNPCHIRALGSCAGTTNICQDWEGDGQSEYCAVTKNGVGGLFKHPLMVYLQTEPKLIPEDVARCGLSGKEPCHEEQN